ncbi:Reverse transcriptase, partial [Phytophthora palmivora]
MRCMIEHPEWDALGVASDATRFFKCPSDVQSLGQSTVQTIKYVRKTFFDDIFVHSRAEDGQTAME